MIFFRFDLNEDIGFGHYRRCLAIANEFSKLSFDFKFICTIKSKNLLNRNLSNLNKLILIDNKDNILIDAEEVLKILKNFSYSKIIVDNYFLDINWDNYIKKHSIDTKIIAIEDFIRKRNIDLLINYSELNSDSYDNFKIKNILLGPKYNIIDDKILNIKSQVNFKYKLNNALICFGGTDFTNENKKIFHFIKNRNLRILKNIKFTVLNSNRNINIKNFSFKTGFKKNIEEYYKDSDLSIGSFGTMCYERSFLKLPSINIKTSIFQDNNEKIFLKGNANLSSNLSDKDSIKRTFKNINKILKSRNLLFKLSYNSKKICRFSGKNLIISRILAL